MTIVFLKHGANIWVRHGIENNAYTEIVCLLTRQGGEMKYYFKGAELRQFTLIIECYRSYVMHDAQGHGELPDAFKTEEEDAGLLGIHWLFSRKRKRVLYQYPVNSFDRHYWKLPPVTMIPLRNALNVICAYQMNRSQRSVGAGHLQDPTNLFCEQLKIWLSQLARQDFSGSDTIKSEINSYITYLKTLDQNHVFPGSHAKLSMTPEITINSMMNQVAGCLNKVIDEIEYLEKRRSLRDVIRRITLSTASAVDHSLQYLFYILRSNRAPAAVNMQSIRETGIHLPTTIQDTRSFKMLYQLLSSPYVREVNQQSFIFGEQLTFAQYSAGFIVHQKAVAGVRIKSNQSRQQSLLNRKLGGNLIPDRHIVRRWFSNVHSGIDLYFQDNVPLLNDFVLLHHIVERIASFSLVCRQMEDLIDAFGMMTWAQLGSRILKYFEDIFRSLNEEYHGCVDRIHRVAYQYYNQLVQQNKRSRPWSENYHHADQLHDAMLTDMSLAFGQIGQIPSVLDRFRPAHQNAQMPQQLKGVVQSLNQFGLFFKMQPISLEAQQASEDQARLTL